MHKKVAFLFHFGFYFVSKTEQDSDRGSQRKLQIDIILF